MRQPNGCSTPALKSSAAKHWIKELAQTKEARHSLQKKLPTKKFLKTDKRNKATTCCVKQFFQLRNDSSDALILPTFD